MSWNRPRPPSPSAPPPAPDPTPAPVPSAALDLLDTLGLIFARLPDPASLVSAALVNKTWYNVVSSSLILDRFRRRQHARLVGFFTEFECGKEFIHLPLPNELRNVSPFLTKVFHDGLLNVEDISSGCILLKLEDSVAICNPFEKIFDMLPPAPRFHHVGYSCGDFYLFHEDTVMHVDAVLEANLMHVQLSVFHGTWIQSNNTILLDSVQMDEPLCRPALCVDGYVYMLSVNGFVVKVKIDDCSLSTITLPKGSYEWGFQQICQAKDSDFLYLHVDGFFIQIWSCVRDEWNQINNIYLPSLFGKHVEVKQAFSSIKWDDSRSGWGEYVTIYGTTNGAEQIFLGISWVEDLFLLDIPNGDVIKIGQKVSDEKGDMIGNCISPLVTGWVPVFPRMPAASFSNTTVSKFKLYQTLDTSCLRSLKLNQYNNTDSENSTQEKIVPATEEKGKAEVKAKEPKQVKITGPAAAAKPKSIFGISKKDAESDNDESDDESDDDSDGALIPIPAGDDSDDSSEGDDSSESDDESDDEETPKKPEFGKKRAAGSVLKTPASDNKKAKIATPSGQKTGDKKGAVHVATPHPAKKAGKTPATNEKSLKSGGSIACKSCPKTFNSENALQAHSNAKHEGAAK